MLERKNNKVKVAFLIAVLHFCSFNLVNAQGNVTGIKKLFDNLAQNNIFTINKNFYETLNSFFKSNASASSRKFFNKFYFNYYEKDGVCYLLFKHIVTGVNIVFKLKVEKYNYIFFGAPAKSDAGESHGLEHVLASPIREELVKNDKSGSHKDFNGETNENGIFFKFSNLAFREDLEFDEGKDETNIMTIIFNQLLKPLFLVNKDIFKVEVYNKDGDNEIGRVFNEVLDNERSKKDNSNSFKRLRYNDYGGVSDRVSGLTQEDLEKYYKDVIVSNNMLIVLSLGDDLNKIEKALRFIDRNLLSKIGEQHNKNFEPSYVLKKDELYMHRLWDKNSRLFKDHAGVELNGKVEKYYYDCVGRVCFDISSLNIDQKDALNLCEGCLNLYPKITDVIHSCGYDFVKFDTHELYKDRLVLSFYGKKGENFSKDSLINNAKKILNEADNYVNELFSLQNVSNFYNVSNFCAGLGKDLVMKMCACNRNNSLDDPEKYRKYHSFKDLFYYSFVKYKNPFSEKVFKIQKQSEFGRKIVDDTEQVKENFINNVRGIFSILANMPILYIDCFNSVDKENEKKDKKEKKYENLDVPTGLNFNTNFSNVSFRFVEYILLNNFLNPKIRKKGLSYSGLRPASYVGGRLMFHCNSKSRKAINKFLAEFFKEGEKFDIFKIGDDMEKFRKLPSGVSYRIFNRENFEILINSFNENLTKDIFSIKIFLENLNKENKFFSECLVKNYDIAKKYEAIQDIRERVKDIDFVFNDKKTYEEYKKEKDKYDKWYYNFYDLGVSSDNEEKDFMQHFVDYTNHIIKFLNILLSELEEMKQDLKKLQYKESLEVLRSFNLDNSFNKKTKEKN